MKAACAAAASEGSAGGATSFVETPPAGGATPVPEAATGAANDSTEGATTDSEAATGASAGAAPAAAAATARAIKVGDVVIGKAHKYKEKYNNVEARVTSIYVKHYGVTLLSGPARGNHCKYLHTAVSLKPPLASVFQAATGAAPQAATVADNAGTAEPEAAAADAPAATSASPILSVAELWNEADF